ncbi:MAG TPA: PEP-CTERM sorting domain-containing protein [Aquabacterium sp.]|nr:PEP-CTERM sorting domain-containing protein [Aquabacterium sp.]
MDNLRITPVPEPETYALSLAGLVLKAGMARRKKQAA